MVEKVAICALHQLSGPYLLPASLWYLCWDVLSADEHAQVSEGFRFHLSLREFRTNDRGPLASESD